MNDASDNHGDQEKSVSTYSVDIETLQQAALAGDPQALFQLAINYEQGRGVAENQQEAFYCYHQAAELGHVTAQLNLGWAYSNGIGVPQDNDKAFYWYQKAARQGHPTAQFDLGFCYINGLGVEKDEQHESGGTGPCRRTAQSGLDLCKQQQPAELGTGRVLVRSGGGTGRSPRPIQPGLVLRQRERYA